MAKSSNEDKIRMMREFTLRTNVGTAEGAGFAQGAERYLTGLLKSFDEKMQVLTRTVINNNQRATTFTFPPKAEQLMQNAVMNLPNELGLTGASPFRGIRDPQIDTVRFAQITKLVEDAKTRSLATRAARSLGGKSDFDPITNTMSAFVPAGGAGSINSIIDSGNEAVRARAEEGDLATKMQIAKSLANDKARQEKEYKSSMDRAYRRLEAQRRKTYLKNRATPGTSEFEENEMASIARSDERTLVAQRYIEKFPDSPTAMREKAKASKAQESAEASEQKKEEAEKKRSEDQAKNAITGMIRMIVGILAVATGVLAKILTGVLATADNVMQLSLSGSQFNIDSASVRAYSLAMDMIGSSESALAGAYGSVMSQFGDASSLNASLNKDSMGILFGEDMSMFTGLFDRSEYSNPHELLMDAFASVFSTSLSGRGGVTTGMNANQAFSTNLELARQTLGGDASSVMNALWLRMRADKTLVSGGSITGAGVEAYLQDLLSGKNPNSVVNALTQDPLGVTDSELAAKALLEFKTFFESLRTEVFNRMLGSLVDIAAILARIVGPLLMRLNPQAAYEQYSANALTNEAEVLRINNTLESAYAGGLFRDHLSDPFVTKEAFEANAVRAYNNPTYPNIRRLLGTDATDIDYADFLQENSFWVAQLDARRRLFESRDVMIDGIPLTVATTGIDPVTLASEGHRAAMEASRSAAFQERGQFMYFNGSPVSGRVREIMNTLAPGSVRNNNVGVFSLTDWIRDHGITPETLNSGRPGGNFLLSQLLEPQEVKEQLSRITDAVNSEFTRSGEGYLRELARKQGESLENNSNLALVVPQLPDLYKQLNRLMPNFVSRNTTWDDEIIRATHRDNETFTLEIDLWENGRNVGTVPLTVEYGQGGLRISPDGFTLPGNHMKHYVQSGSR